MQLEMQILLLKSRGVLRCPDDISYDTQANHVQKFLELLKNCIFNHSTRKILEVVFFGGEPTLNIEPIRFITEELDRFVKEKNIDLKISYNISTNGVLLDQEILDIFSKHKMNVSLSIDGPPELQNYHRPKIDGKPSYKDVAHNLEVLLTLQKQGKIHLSVEAVITKYSLQRMSLVDLANWFITCYGIRNISFYPVVTSSITDYLKPPSDALIFAWKKFFDFLLEGAVNSGRFPIVEYRTLSTLLKIVLLRAKRFKKIPAVCPAGLEIIALNYDGNLYACGTAVGEKEFRLAHIDDVRNYNDVKKHYMEFYERYLRGALLPCISCSKKFCLEVCPVSLHWSSKCEKNTWIEKYMYWKLTSIEKSEKAMENLKKAVKELRFHAIPES